MGADLHADGRARLRRMWQALRDVVAETSEAQQRLWLLHHPWEERYLHWAWDGDEHVLHGTVPPPADGHRYGVTSGGWCRGLSCRHVDATSDRP